MVEEKILFAIAKYKSKLEALKAEDEVNRKGLSHDGKAFWEEEKLTFQSNVRLIEISSSLMIPIHLLSGLKTKLKKHKGFKLYFHFLLKKYEVHLVNGLLPKYSNVTTKYQDELELKKIGVRPWGSDWAEMHILRCSHGMSMSAIFAYLLKVDLAEFAEIVSEMLVKAGIPTFTNYNLTGEVRLEENKFQFYRVFRYTENFTLF